MSFPRWRRIPLRLGVATAAARRGFLRAPPTDGRGRPASLRRELLAHPRDIAQVALGRTRLLRGTQHLARHLEELALLLAQVVVHLVRQFLGLVAPGRTG